jgi:hypothetical protein
VAAYDIAAVVERAQVRPLPVAPHAPESPVPPTAGDGCESRLVRFARSLADLTGPNTIGRPLGPDTGLETALSLLSLYFAVTEAVRTADMELALSIVGATSDQRFTPTDIHYVMGRRSWRATRPAARRLRWRSAWPKERTHF